MTDREMVLEDALLDANYACAQAMDERELLRFELLVARKVIEAARAKDVLDCVCFDPPGAFGECGPCRLAAALNVYDATTQKED